MIFILVSRWLKWCPRCSKPLSLFKKEGLPNRTFISSLKRRLNVWLPVARTFVLLESNEFPMSWQCSWTADEFLKTCSVTRVSLLELWSFLYSLVCRTLSTGTCVPFCVTIVIIISSTTFADDARNKRDIVWGKHTEGVHGLMPVFFGLLTFLNVEFLLSMSSFDLLIVLLMAEVYSFCWNVENFLM